MKLHFDAALVQRLFDHSLQSAIRSPTFDQLFVGKYRKDGRDLDLARIGTDALPTHNDIDPSKIEPGLWLVGDDGVYLMSNGNPRLLAAPPATRNLIAIAEEADPARHPDTWYDTKEAAFGGDDGVIALSRDFVTGLLAAARDGRVCIDLTPTRAMVAIPQRAGSPRRRRAASADRSA
jgi:hypothetical protein